MKHFIADIYRDEQEYYGELIAAVRKLVKYYIENHVETSETGMLRYSGGIAVYREELLELVKKEVPLPQEPEFREDFKEHLKILRECAVRSTRSGHIIVLEYLFRLFHLDDFEAYLVILSLADERLRSGEEEGKEQRHNLKREEAIHVINDHKGKALETLIARTKKLPVSEEQNTQANGNGNTAAQEADDALVSESKYQGGGNLSKRELFKRKLGFRSIKEKALYIARNWRKIMKEEHEKISDGLKGMFDFTSDAAGMGADIGDIQDMDEVMEGMLDADTSGGGLVSAVMGGLSGTLKYIRFVINLTKEMKKDMDAGTDVIHTRQERWGMARQYLHDVIDIFNGFKSGFGPMTKMVPFFNSITSGSFFLAGRRTSKFAKGSFPAVYESGESLRIRGDFGGQSAFVCSS